MRTLPTSFSDALKKDQNRKHAMIFRVEAEEVSTGDSKVFYFSNDWEEVDFTTASGVISKYGAIKETIDFYNNSYSYGGFDLSIVEIQDKINDLLSDNYVINRKVEIYYWIEGQDKRTNQDMVFDNARLEANSNILDGATNFEIEQNVKVSLDDTMQIIAGKDYENYIGLLKNGAVFSVMNNKSVTSDFQTMVFRVSAGRFNFSWNNASGRKWYFPDMTVLHSDGTTPIATNTDAQPDVIIPAGGGFVILESDSFSGNYQLKDNNTDAVYIGDLSDIDVSYYLDLYKCSNITGDLSDIDVSYFLDLRYCTNITGALPVPTASTFRAYRIYLSGCSGIDVADSIVNMASYWYGKTAPSGAVLNFGTLSAEYDVSLEVEQLETAGFSVTFTPYV